MKNIIKKDEYKLFETFLQYGDLKEAEYLFMGYEEGLDSMSIEDNIKGRLSWFQSIPEHIEFINNKDERDGYYIDDIFVADYARNSYADPNLITQRQVEKFGGNKTMMFQARLIKMISTNFEFLNNSNSTIQKEQIKKFLVNRLHKKNSKTAMIDYYPLPSRNKKEWDYSHLFADREAYKKAINDNSSKRRAILKKLYDEYPCKVTVCYSGKEEKKEILAFFVGTLGFEHFKYVGINELHESYQEYLDKGLIDLTSKRNTKIEFLKRTKEDGTVQWLVMTPFFGVGWMSYSGIDVIASWILALCQA